ncbi:hypothetical protein MMC12_004285 [Toensbergia leucococca]|nr:hypothetical protein [Toensbergia leucococca]
MPPTFPAPYHSASVDAATCTTNFRNLITQCGKETEITGAFDPNYCSQDGGGGTMGWNDDGSVIANSARYVMKTVGLDSCGQHQATWTPSTPEIEWKDSWVPPNSPMTLDTNEQCGVIPPAPVIQTQGCINGVCYVGDPAYYAVCEGQPTKQAVRTMRHRVVFNGWTTTSGQELLSALRLRCHQDVLNWQAWNNGTAWLAEFGIYGDDRGSSCGCIPEAVFDASVGLEVSPASCCESIIVPAPLFQVV